jgi:cytoskeletal protein RodZ
MEKLSHFLRQEREYKGLSLQEVERELRIPLHYLEILEGAGDKRLVADPIYLIPSLRSYATFLDLDPAAVVTQFTVELQELQQANGRAANPQRPFPVFKQLPRRFGVWSRLAVLVLALGILAFVGQSGEMAARWHWSAEGRVSPLSSSPEVPAAAEPWTPPSTSSSAPSVPPPTTGQSDTSPAPLAEPALVVAARQPEPSVPAAPQTDSVSVGAASQPQGALADSLHTLARTGKREDLAPRDHRRSIRQRDPFAPRPSSRMVGRGRLHAHPGKRGRGRADFGRVRLTAFG